MYPVAISNQMGGAGKTTTAINLAGALADRGNDVLLVDADPQGTATEGVGLTDLYDKDIPSLYDILVDLDRTDELDEVIREHPGGEMDVVPSNIAMHKLEYELLTRVPQSEARLQATLEHVQDDYDYAIVDSPPQFGQISDNAILAAGRVIIPCQAKRRSIRALEILGEQLTRLERGYDVEIDRLAIVVNEVEYPPDNDQTEMLDWVEGLPPEVFEVRSRVEIRRAWNAGVSVFGHDGDRDAQEDVYRELAAHVEQHAAQEVPQA